MKQGRHPPRPPSCQYQLELQQPAQSPMFSTVRLISEGQEGQQSCAQDVSERMGQSHPKFFFCWPPPTLRFNCRAEKSLQLWFLLDKMEVTHTKYHGPHTGFAVIGMSDQSQDMTTKPQFRA